MTLAGAFGSGALKIVPRLAYWLAQIAAGVTMGVAVGVWLIPRRWFDSRPWLAWAAIVAALWLPMTLVVALANAAIDHRAVDAALFARIGPSTLATTAAMTALAFLVRGRAPVETHAAPGGAAPARFLDRLPARLAGAILWAVEAEDHYLRLHTSAGQDLILMRLTDAVAELEGIEGARTHRSWWVARDAVTRIEREDGRARLVLADGAQAPVSRAGVRALREAGWF
jgi:DNA-binding LytR/AlgR family response regulator